MCAMMGTHEDQNVPVKHMQRFETSLLILLVVAGVASCVGAPYPHQMYLQHIPTGAILIALAVVARRRFFSPAAFTCIVGFMLLHVVGARYIYSYVPYDEWAQKLFGITVTDQFGFRRNHFDRVVHFAFGILSVRPVWEILTRKFEVPSRFALYASVEFVLAFSLLYELFEWGLTMVLSPEDAGAYNGEQGDIYDAHRDMALAFLGSCMGLMVWGVAAARRGRAAA